MSRTRNRLVAAVFLVALAALTFAHSLVERTAAAQAQNAVQAPRFEVDPLWPKPLPNHWLLGSTIGVAGGRTRSRMDHPPQLGDARRDGAGRRGEPACRRMLQRGAAGPRIRSGRQSGRLLGRPRPGVRVATVESRHLHRPQRQRLDRWKRCGRLSRPEVHAGRQVLAQYGKQQRTPHLRNGTDAKYQPAATIPIASVASRRSSSSSQRPTRHAWPTATSTCASRCWTPHGKMKRYWGAYGNKSTDEDLGPYKPDAPPAEQFRNPVALRGCLERRIRVCL